MFASWDANEHQDEQQHAQGEARPSCSPEHKAPDCDEGKCGAQHEVEQVDRLPKE